DVRQVVVVDLQQGDVGGGIATDDLRIDVVPAVAVLVGAVVHLHLAGTFDDVVVGENVAVRRNDEAGTAGDLLPLIVLLVRSGTAAAPARWIGEEKLEWVDTLRPASQVAGSDHFGRSDGDDGRHHARGDIGERR